jgi:predicted MFS family arabinose efflux permease
VIPIALAAVLDLNFPPAPALMLGLLLFMIVFAINSSVHSYLILAYSEDDEVATNVGFYYMANAGGRLIGTLLSGMIFEYYGFIGCLLASGAFVLTAAMLSFNLPRAAGVPLTVKLKEAES